MASNNETIGAKFEIDVSNLKSGITEANRYIRLADSEFKATAASMDDWTASEDGLIAKQKQLSTTLQMQNAKVEALQKAYEQTASEMGETSAEAVNLQIRLNKAKEEYNKTEKELDQCSTALEEFGQEATTAGKKIKSAADDADDASGKFGKFSSALKTGLGALVGAGAGAIGSILGLGQASEELIQHMGQLETAFTSNGKTIEQANKTYSDFYGLVGDSDQAVEAANNLSKMALSEQELSQWADISAGAFARMGSALPIENLAEGAMEASKTGVAVGGLTDALVWAGINEEEFNAQLQSLNSEQERAAFITETLNGIYGEAGQQYRDVNAELIASREAQADMNQAMADAGTVIMPLQTMLMNFATGLLNEALPGLEQFSDGMNEVFNADTEAGAQQMADGISGALESVIQRITDSLPQMVTAGVAIINGLLTGLISAIPSLITGIVQALPVLISGIGEMLVNLIDAVTAMLPQLINEAIPAIVEAIGQTATALIQVLPKLIEALILLVTTLVEQLPTFLPLLIEAAMNLFMGITTALIQVIPQIIQTIINMMPQLTKAILDALPLILQAAIQLFTALVQAIPVILPQLISAIINMQPQMVSTIISMLPQIISAAFQLFMGIVKAVPQIAGSLIGAVGSLLGQIPGIIAGYAGSVASAAGEMINGMVEGILGSASNIGTAVKNLCQNALDGIKSYFGIHSPSRVMRKLFKKDWGGGVALGITDAIPAILDAEKKLNKEIENGLNPDIDFDFDVPSNGGRGGRGGRTIPTGENGTVSVVQNFYSPEAITAKDAYRQGRKLKQTLAHGW